MMWGPLVSQGERELAKSSKVRQLGLAAAISDLAVLEGENGELTLPSLGRLLSNLWPLNPPSPHPFYPLITDKVVWVLVGFWFGFVF